MKNFKLILRSLLSNHSCVEGGRRKPWYFAVPMFFLALIIAIVPIFVQTITKQGDSLVSSNAYEMDTSSYYFLKEINEKGITLEVKEGQLLVDKDKWNETFTTTDPSGNNCYIHYHDETPDLGVYYMSYDVLQNKYNSIITFPSGEEGKTISRNYSFVIFTEKSVMIYVYASGKSSNQSIGSIPGDYKNLKDGWTINSMFVEGNRDATWKNWKEFYRRAYDNNRLTATWQTTLIITGVNAAITIFMGFMLWVLTRGKNNLNWFTLWETQKIAYWTMITPAILTAGLGFLLSSFAQVMFALLLGVRIMWLSMKLLRPENATLYPRLKDEKVVKVKEFKR